MQNGNGDVIKQLQANIGAMNQINSNTLKMCCVNIMCCINLCYVSMESLSGFKL